MHIIKRRSNRTIPEEGRTRGSRDGAARNIGSGLPALPEAAALEDLELSVTDENGIMATNCLQPIEAIAQLGDVGEKVSLDDLLNGGHIRVFV